MSKKRKISVVVSARPSYSRIKTALQAIKDHPELELQLVVGASALLDRYGNAVDYIEKDGFDIASKVYMVLEGENLTSMAKTTGLGLLEITTAFDNLRPDIVVTVADRFETIATAIAASYMNIPVAHVQGGEVTGNIDERVRHAVTKLSDMHFVSTQRSYDRVIAMGENAERVFITGCPSIDIADEVAENPELDFDPFKKYGGVGNITDISDGYIVAMQHPVTTEYGMSRAHVNETLNAVKDLDIPVFWFWPNVDAGADGTSKGIRAFREKNPDTKIHFFKSMEPMDFLKVLKNSKCLVGNSSVGIRESSYLGVPVVNIGSRQRGRERGRNVIDVDYDSGLIKTAIENQMNTGHYERDTIYGDGKAGEKIADLLASAPLTIDKIISY
ncbi:MAG: UDP-N-acetylglucosamine 2-epimerase (hydrolyzing) [Ignavibacteriae bacterium]|nr:UDP-N-acetylglucosamine 2-epimerase (hydrolyzing) [Ignavibacteriota bacterium]